MNPASPDGPNAASSSALPPPRPRRVLVASGKLLDASNSAAPTLTFHKQAVEARRADDAAKRRLQPDTAPPASTASAPSSPPVGAIPDADTDAVVSDFESERPRECLDS